MKNTYLVERFLSRKVVAPSAEFVERTRRMVLAQFSLSAPKRMSVWEFLRMHYLQTGLGLVGALCVLAFVVVPFVSPTDQTSLDSISFSMETL